MPRPRPPHLVREYSRHGTGKWYVRFGHGSRVRIRAAFGTQEFDAEVVAAKTGGHVQIVPKVRTGSLQWLYDRYRESGAWTDEISAATRRQRENIFAGVMAQSGSEPFGEIRQSDIEAARESR